MPPGSTHDGWVLRYRHSDASFVLTEPVASIPFMVDYTVAPVTSNQVTRTVNRPNCVAGDWIFFVYTSDGDNDVASMSGFTPMFAMTNFPSNVGAFRVFYKVAGGSEPSTYTITNTVSERAAIVGFTVRGMSAINVQGTPTTANSTTASFPAITTTVNNCLRINISMSYRDVLPYGTMPGFTKYVENAVASGGAVCVAYKDYPTAGMESGTTYLLTQTLSGWGQITFAVEP